MNWLYSKRQTFQIVIGMYFSSANTLTHPIIPFHTECIVFSCVIYGLLCFMAILPHSSSLCFTFELFNLQLELTLLGNYNVYISCKRLKENVIVAVRTESEKVENHRGSNKRVTLNVLSGEEVVML